VNAAHQSPMPPELLEPARAQPCEEGMDDQGEYAAARGREALEGGLWLPLEVPSHD